MASTAPVRPLERLRSHPLHGARLGAAVLVVWLIGALYCSGYEALASGIDNWPGSLWWSAAAVLPWLALFEWSKSHAGRRATASPVNLALVIVFTVAVSLALEYASDFATGGQTTPIALALMRRLPAAGVALVLILWARSAATVEADQADESLAAMAGSIDWIAAADNYVELHIRGRVNMRRMTMREAEKALAGRGFVRIHRRYLVNGRRIEAVTGNGDQIVRLSSGAELPVGRRYAANLALPR
jgi:hypothetical protein